MADKDFVFPDEEVTYKVFFSSNSDKIRYIAYIVKEN